MLAIVHFVHYFSAGAIVPKFKQFDSFQIDVRSRDHNPPHFHVIGPDFHALIRIDSFEVLPAPFRQGRFATPSNGQKRTSTRSWWNGDASMNEIDAMVAVGDPLPTIAAVQKGNEPYDLVVTWASGLRAGRTDVVDTAPHILTFKVYKQLRDDVELFARVSITQDRTAVVWPGNSDWEISADALEDFAEQTMTSAAFADFIRSKSWTLDAAAAQLGISRRQVAYYAKERSVPRLVALACLALKHDDTLAT